MKIKQHIIVSLLSGIVLTVLFVAAGAWSSAVECGYDVYPATEQVRYKISDFKPCVGMKYGYPQRFVIAQPNLELQVRPNQNLALNDFQASSAVTFDKSAFLTNWATWSGLSLIMIVAFATAFRSSRKTTKNRNQK